jgi:hypothetical protein
LTNNVFFVFFLFFGTIENSIAKALTNNVISMTINNGLDDTRVVDNLVQPCVHSVFDTNNVKHCNSSM